MRHALAWTGLFLFFSCTFASSFAFAGPGETPDAAMRFEVADIHSTPKSTNSNFDGMGGGLMAGGRYELRRATMLDLIHTAYDIRADKVVGGPSWLELDKFDIVAKAPAGATPASAKLMLKALLADRFHLVVRNDKQPLPAFALTAGKKPQLKKAEGSGEAGCKFDVQGRGAADAPTTIPTIVYNCHNMTMAAFAAGMPNMPAAGPLGESLVEDQTGLEGEWDFSFQYNARGRIAAPGATVVSLTDAVEKQLGLKVDAAKIPMAVLVVDSVDRKPTPNGPDVAAAFPPLPTEFEVATIKPTDPDFQGGRFEAKPGGRINIQGIPLKPLISDIWGLTDDMIVGVPKFAETDRWDIVAKAPAAVAILGAGNGQDELPVDIDTLIQMVKTLLVERFKLSYHMEERPMPAYTLSSIKPKMKKADPNSRTLCKEGPAMMSKTDARDANPILGRLLTCQNTSTAQLAELLPSLANGYVHSAVLDNTGLEGGWDFTLSFSTIGQLRGGDGRGGTPPGQASGDAAADPNGAVSLPDAMEKQLGLKMELQKRPVEVLVIDHLEQKPIEN